MRSFCLYEIFSFGTPCAYYFFQWQTRATKRRETLLTGRIKTEVLGDGCFEHQKKGDEHVSPHTKKITTYPNRR